MRMVGGGSIARRIAPTSRLGFASADIHRRPPRHPPHAPRRDSRHDFSVLMKNSAECGVVLVMSPNTLFYGSGKSAIFHDSAFIKLQTCRNVQKMILYPP